MLSLFFWSVQLKRLGYSSRFIFTFVVLAGLSEPFVSTAEKLRYEYLSLLLISAGLLCTDIPAGGARIFPCGYRD
jgi:hypothetical protein